MKFLEAYNTYLSTHPNLVHGFLFFVFCVSFLWWRTFVARDKILKGLQGKNELLEAGEIVILTGIWCTPPVLFYITFFTDQFMYGLWFIGGIMAYALMGRYIFDWALAFKTGKSEVVQTVDPEPPKVTVTTTTETKTK